MPVEGRACAVMTRNWKKKMRASHSLCQLIGLDRAVTYTVAARIFQIVGSLGTVLLILKFMSPVEQGYYYTLLSLAALQTIFELGFSFVILQMATHEAALATVAPDGSVNGDRAAYSRLASVLQVTIRWYRRCAVTFAFVVAPLGVLFFEHSSNAASGVTWFWPWLSAVTAVSVVLFMTPLFSFIEGCGQVPQVARVRMLQAFVVFLCSWAAVASGHGLYACALVNVGWIAVGLRFLVKNLPLFRGLLGHEPAAEAVSWRRDIWPFQWKIAVTWLCSYLTMQAFTPILFADRGATTAGRMGLAINIASCLQAVALAWVSPKAAPFGALVRRGEFAELRRLFTRAFWQSMGVFAGLAALFLSGAAVCQASALKIAVRMESTTILALLLIGATANLAVQAMGIYLRSYKREPFLVQSVAFSTVTLGLVLWLTPRWGSMAVASIFCSMNVAVGLPWAASIFFVHRRAGSDALPRLDPVFKTN